MKRRSEAAEPTEDAAFAGVDDIAPSGPSIVLTDWDKVRIERVHWLMLNRMPFAELTIVEGVGGLGKTTAVLDIAARASSGRDMPDGTPFSEATNVVLVAEEDRTSILKARLRAAGADLNRIHHVSAVGEDGDRFSLPSHGGALLNLVEATRARLVVIDAMFNHIDAGLKIAASEDMRRVLSPLSVIAHRSGAAVIGIRHWGKAARSAASRGLGSIDITNFSRSVLAVGRHPTDDRVRVIAVAKSNLGDDVASVRAVSFSIESATIEDELDATVRVDVGRIRWGGEVDVSADDLAAKIDEVGEDRSQLAAARELLREILADGPVRAKDVQQRLAAEGYNRRLWFRARAAAGVKSSSIPGVFPRQTMWSLPTRAHRPAHARDNEKIVTTGSLQSNGVTTVRSDDSGDVYPCDRAGDTTADSLGPIRVPDDEIELDEVPV